MKSKSKFKLLVSEITAVGINVVPLLLWFFEDYSAEIIMVLYALENVVALLLAVLLVFLLAPLKEISDSNMRRVRSKLVGDFLIMGLGLMFACGLFLSFFIFVVLKSDITLSAIGFGLLGIAAFQLFEFFSNLYLLPFRLFLHSSILPQFIQDFFRLLISISQI